MLSHAEFNVNREIERQTLCGSGNAMEKSYCLIPSKINRNVKQESHSIEQVK